jgi:hypothetical protein
MLRATNWQYDRVPKASPRRRGIRVLCLSFVLVIVGLLAGGCVRVHAAIAVSTDDRVSGDVVIASLPSAQNGQGPQLTIPTTMAAQVTTKSYKADGYVGSELTFTSLTFTEVSALATAISNENGTYKIVFQRSGDLVNLDGSVDLSQLSVKGVDVQIKVTFPNPPVRADGALDGDTVTWTMKPGQVTSFSAADQYTLGNTRGWRFWALTLGGGGAIISMFVVLLALWARRRNLKKEQAYLAAV